MTLPFTRFEGLAYRAHHPAWAFALESGDGARLHGGRFNRVGTACFYSALSVETAWLEAQQGFAFKAQPLTICTYRVDVADLLDLTDPAVCAAAQVNPSDLGCPWELLASDRQPVPTWALAERLVASGCAGIIVPSFAFRATHANRNLVLWSWSRTPPHKIEVIDDEGRLPHDQSSWSM